MSSRKGNKIILRDHYLREEGETHRQQLSLVHPQREEDQLFVINHEPLNGSLNLMKYPAVEYLRIVNYGPISGYFDIGHEMNNSERVEFFNRAEITGELTHSRGPGTENIWFFDCRDTFLPATYPIRDPGGFYESLGHIVNSLGLSRLPARLTANGETPEATTKESRCQESSKNKGSSGQKGALVKVSHHSAMEHTCSSLTVSCYSSVVATEGEAVSTGTTQSTSCTFFTRLPMKTGKRKSLPVERHTAG